MSEVFKNRKISSPFGIFFQIPVFIVAIFGLYNLIERIYYSLTKFNMLEKPTFVGLENYASIFKDEMIQDCLGNTLFMVCAVVVLLMLTAVLPAVFTARLKLPFGLGVICAFSLISVCAMLPNFFNMFFSGDRYGMLNSWLLSKSIINEPIIFKQSHAMMLAVIVFWLYCLAPVFSITYIAARMKHSFLGTAIAVSLIPVLMFNGGDIVTGIVGYPSMNYSADWLYTVFQDYLMVRFDVGFAYAILIIGLIMLFCWCVLVCSVAFGFWTLCKNMNPNSMTFKVVGFITFAFAMQLFVVVLIFIITYLLKAFMPNGELFLFPNPIMPRNPTLQNFSNLGELISTSWAPFSRYLINSLFVVPLTIMSVCFSVILPSGVGFGLFQAFKKQKLLLLCFIPFLFVSGYVTCSKLGIINSYFVYMFKFLSSFELLIAVFLVYLVVKLVFYNLKPRILDIVLGSFFMVSSFYAIGAIRGIWYSSGGIYNEKLKLWGDISAYISSSGIAKCGIAAANDMLMLLSTIAVVIIPLSLLLALYLLHQRNSDNLTKK